MSVALRGRRFKCSERRLIHLARLAKRPRTAKQLIAARLNLALAREYVQIGPMPSSQREKIGISLRRSYAEGRRVVTVSAATAAAAIRARPLGERMGRVLSQAHKDQIGRGSKSAWARKSQVQREAHGLAGKRAWARLTELQRHARIMPMQGEAGRAHPTSLERSVESLLRVLSVMSISQYRVGRYLVDFYLPEYKLVIECDGEYWHSRPGAVQRDKARDRYIRGLGYRVLRLPERAIKAGKAADALRARLSAC